MVVALLMAAIPGVIYFREDQSLGAAHWVAQWARWKTVLACISLCLIFFCVHQSWHDQSNLRLTLLDAVLLGTPVVLLGSDALDALIVVVLGGVALL